jgi:hypothetical protein
VIFLLAQAGGSESLALIGFGGAAAVGILLCGLGNIICLVTPFRESIVCGFLYIFMPFYHLYYLITRWDVMERPFIMILAGAPFWAFVYVSVVMAWMRGGGPPMLQEAVAQVRSEVNLAARRAQERAAQGAGTGPPVFRQEAEDRRAPTEPPAASVEEAERADAAGSRPPMPAAPLRTFAPDQPAAPAPPRHASFPRARGPIQPGPGDGTNPVRQGRRIARALDDVQSPDQRRRVGATKALSDPASAAAVAELLGTPQSARAIATLTAMGPAAEVAVIPHLRSDNWFARGDACQVLKVIGTEKSVPALRVIAGNHGPNAGAARAALSEIARRSGTHDPLADGPAPTQRSRLRCRLFPEG